MLTIVFVLLVVFQLKHYVADYLLQGKYMLQKFKPGWDFFFPLLAHVAVHGLMTFMIAVAVGADIEFALNLAALDIFIHFTMDRIKAGPKYLGRFKALSAGEWGSSTPIQKRNNTIFWWALGFDQMVHHLTHYYIIWRLIS